MDALTINVMHEANTSTHSLAKQAKGLIHMTYLPTDWWLPPLQPQPWQTYRRVFPQIMYPAVKMQAGNDYQNQGRHSLKILGGVS